MTSHQFNRQTMPINPDDAQKLLRSGREELGHILNGWLAGKPVEKSRIDELQAITCCQRTLNTESK